jgi:adenylate cyclase, class 2
MREIELKFLEIDKNGLEKKLIAMGGKLTFKGNLESLFFDYEDLGLRRSGVLIRLRKAGDKTYLTMKKKLPMDDVKAAEETELEVGDFYAAKGLLCSIGLNVTGSISKHRTSYCLSGANYEFEKLPGIPTYLEIEADSIAKLRSAVKKIGLDMMDAKPWSTEQVQSYYR